MSMNDPNLLATFLGRRNQRTRPEIASEACELTRNECRLLILDLARIVETAAAKGTWPAAGDLGKIKACLQEAKHGLAIGGSCRNCGQTPCRTTCVVSYPVQEPR